LDAHVAAAFITGEPFAADGQEPISYLLAATTSCLLLHSTTS
jgi:hypothetical protein